MSQPSPGSSNTARGNRGIDEDSAVLGSDSKPVPGAQQEGVTATTDSVASLFWFVWSSAAWQEYPVAKYVLGDKAKAISLAALASGVSVEGSESDQGHRCLW